MSAFVDRLELALSLKIAGTEHAVPPGNVKRVELVLSEHGFSGSAEFCLTDDSAHGGGYSDELREAFLGSDLIEITLGASAVNAQAETGQDPCSIGSVTGIVQRRRLREEALGGSGDLPVLWRRYEVTFADPARVLWGQHFPCELFVDKSLKDVIDGYKNAHLEIDYAWPDLEASRRQIFVFLPRASGASFHDFLHWYAAGQNGYFVYDYAAKKYSLRNAKLSLSPAVKAFGDDVALGELVLPELSRSAPRVLNTSTEDPRTTALEAATALAPIRQDFLARTPIAQSFDARSPIVSAVTRARGAELELRFARFPSIPLAPGQLVSFEAARRFGAESALGGKTLRVFECRLAARALADAADADRDAPNAAYRVEVAARLEAETEPTVELPAYRAPAYPGHVEGKIVSGVGEENERTYDFSRDDQSSLQYYTIKIPLWAEQQVVAPFEPHHMSGNIYIPAYRDARVLLAFWLEDARVERLLDWREGVPLAKDAQGEQILFGKTATSQTSVNHVYEDAKPVFNLVRKNASDRASIRLEEGGMIIKVQETSGEAS